MTRSAGSRRRFVLLVLGAVLATAAGGIGIQLAPDLLPAKGASYSLVDLLPFLGVVVVSGAVGVFAGYLSWLLFQPKPDKADDSTAVPPRKRGMARLRQVFKKNRRFGMVGMII